MTIDQQEVEGTIKAVAAKRCHRCHEEKPVSDFNVHRARPDGFNDLCRPCHREMVRESERRHREAKRLKQRRWAAENPEKIKAHAAVREAVLSGRLVKPEECEGCGVARDMHAHHTDYSQPLDVEWLCPPCHRERHGQEVRDAA